MCDSPQPTSDITRLLVALRTEPDRAGGVVEELFVRLYDELRRLATAQMRRERVEHTLEATALVHEAYLRLIDESSIELRDKSHFFAVCAQVMRRLLIDHHREKIAEKRGGGRVRVTYDDALAASPERELDVLALDDALTRLSELDARKCRVVELRFFCGMSIDEIAAALGVSKRTAEGDWTFARVWLERELSRGEC
jgi:RNA polymerase sigma-70 factor (ECF subfamily)